MKILNLGCGTKVSSSSEVVNIDRAPYLYMKKNALLRYLAPYMLKGKYLEKFNALPKNILVHNLAKGIPFADDSVGVVYHAHLLEHLDRDIAVVFLKENRRVLKPGGILRIVVPDGEYLCKAYLSHLSICENNADEIGRHDSFVAALIEQSVRKEASCAKHHKPLRRIIENIFMGDARRRGDTHQWMYDRINLKAVLVDLGYREVSVETYNTSRVPHWNEYGLDANEDGNQNKPGSLYLEALK